MLEFAVDDTIVTHTDDFIDSSISNNSEVDPNSSQNHADAQEERSPAQMSFPFGDPKQSNQSGQTSVADVKDIIHVSDSNLSQINDLMTFLLDPLHLLHRTFLSPNRIMSQATSLL